MDWMKLFFSPDGRINRQAYWVGWLALFGANFVLSWTAIVPLVTIYCWICISAKRFHDMGKSGWLAAIPVIAGLVLPMLGVVALFIGIAAAAISNEAGEGAAAAGVLGGLGVFGLFILVGSLIGLVFLIWQGVAEGDPAENRYGPPPPAGL